MPTRGKLINKFNCLKLQNGEYYVSDFNCGR